MMIALEGLCFTASYLGLLSAPPLSQLPQRSTAAQDMALSTTRDCRNDSQKKKDFDFLQKENVVGR